MMDAESREALVISMLIFVAAFCFTFGLTTNAWRRRWRDMYQASHDEVMNLQDYQAELRGKLYARPAVLKARETRLIAGELSAVETEVLERVGWRGKAYTCTLEEADSPE